MHKRGIETRCIKAVINLKRISFTSKIYNKIDNKELLVYIMLIFSCIIRQEYIVCTRVLTICDLKCISKSVGI